MPVVVIDTSALLAVLLNEASRAALVRATEGHDLVGAPSLPWEVGNALVAAYRRGRLSPEEARLAWASYLAVPVRLVQIDVDHALQTAVELGLYAYDAYVLEAAQASQLPVLSLDRGLARAARRAGIRLMEFDDEGL
jgi:predicted nucleic acid-binding protein